MPDEPKNQSQEQPVAAAPAPSVETEPTTAAPAFPQTQPSPTIGSGSKGGGSKKKLIVGGILAALLVVFVGGGALAYNLWYQNPDKVILDSIGNLIDAKNNSGSGKVTMSLENKETKVDITTDFKGKALQATGSADVNVTMKSSDTPANLKNIKLSVDFAYDKTTVYFKAKGIKAAIEAAYTAYLNNLAQQYKAQGIDISPDQLQQGSQSMMQSLDPLLSKVEDQWIKIDTNSFSSTNDSSKCVSDAIDKFTNDSSQHKELLDIYSKNKFVTVDKKLGSKNGSLGYSLTFDQDKAKSFGSAVKDSTLGKALQSCDKSSSSSFDSSSSDSSTTKYKEQHFEVWVSRWSHEITEFKANVITDESDPTSISLDMTRDNTKVGDLTMPSGATDIKDLESQLMGTMMGGGSDSSVSALMTKPSTLTPPSPVHSLDSFSSL